MENLAAVLFDLALVVPPLAVLFGAVALALPSRAGEAPGEGTSKQAA